MRQRLIHFLRLLRHAFGRLSSKLIFWRKSKPAPKRAKYFMVEVPPGSPCNITATLLACLQLMDIGMIKFDFRLWRHFNMVVVQLPSYSAHHYDRVLKQIRHSPCSRSVHALPDDYDFSPSPWKRHIEHLGEYYKIPVGFYIVSDEYIDGGARERVKSLQSKFVFRNMKKRTKQVKKKTQKGKRKSPAH